MPNLYNPEDHESQPAECAECQAPVKTGELLCLQCREITRLKGERDELRERIMAITERLVDQALCRDELLRALWESLSHLKPETPQWVIDKVRKALDYNEEVHEKYKSKSRQQNLEAADHPSQGTPAARPSGQSPD